MQENYMRFGINPRCTSLICTLMAQRSRRKEPSGWPVHLFLHKLEDRGIAFAHQILGEITLTLLAINHPDVFAHYVFTPRAPLARYCEDGVFELIPTEQRDLLLPAHAVVGIANSGISLEFSARDDDPDRLPARVPLRTLESYGPDGANIFIGTTVLDMLRELHPGAFAAHPNLSFQPHDQP